MDGTRSRRGPELMCLRHPRASGLGSCGWSLRKRGCSEHCRFRRVTASEGRTEPRTYFSVGGPFDERQQRGHRAARLDLPSLRRSILRVFGPATPTGEICAAEAHFGGLVAFVTTD